MVSATNGVVTDLNMINSLETPVVTIDQQVKIVKEEEQTFETLGLEPRLTRALIKQGITKPTHVQRLAIPKIIEGKQVVCRANTGSGKTLAYVLPLLQKLSLSPASIEKFAPSAIILVPSKELCKQVLEVVSELIDLSRMHLVVRSVIKDTRDSSASNLRKALAEQPDILISTPLCIKECFSAGFLQPMHVKKSLSFLILDEADDMLLRGYGDDLKALTTNFSRGYQGILMSATSSADVENLNKLILRDPYVLDLLKVEEIKEQIVPKNVQQFWISCSADNKLVYILALLMWRLVREKVLIFTNTIDMSFKVKLLCEKFGIKSAVLNAELPHNSRLHILERFNAGLFDCLIATDDNYPKEKEQARNLHSKKHSKQKLDSEFGVARGIDFKNVRTVINFQMPRIAAGYVHRVGRTGRAHHTGEAISLVSPEEMENFAQIKSLLGESESEGSNLISRYPLLNETNVGPLRYRVEDASRSVNKIAIREARYQDLRNEILNSERLESHFQANPNDLDLLKHDKIVTAKGPDHHLRVLPDYLIDPKTQAASKTVQLVRLVSGRNSKNTRCGREFKGGNRSDPLKSFSTQGSMRKCNSGRKRKGEDRDRL